MLDKQTSICKDPSSFSNPAECKVYELTLQLTANFEKKILSGTTHIKIKRETSDASFIILDTRDLTIIKAYDECSGLTLNHELKEAVESFGSPLYIHLPANMELKEFSIAIDYETSPESTALQWLDPEQTSGKVHPYLFSHSEAIHARSMFPCQDTPSVKCPYFAEITAPKELTALMSAHKLKEEQSPDNEAMKISTFELQVPIPSYLIALVVGALESRKIGPRSHVWSEIEYVDKAAFEFSETEAMLHAAEEITSPYVWGNYDLLVMPPSFPFGGMENPCLTFVTPTLLAGDKSLATVVGHEISHSWTGNLVTNSTFEHFWLNEGFTMFLERKITTKLYGEPHRHLEALGGWRDLQDTINARGENDPLTKLVPNLESIDPDDAFSTVPYEKGHTLLFYLEQLLGGPKMFDPFLKAYIKEFEYKSLNTNEWKAFLYKYFENEKEKLDSVDWDAWLYTPGMPPIKPDFDTTLEKQYVELAEKWLECEDSNMSQFKHEDIESLSPLQFREFFSYLLLKEKISSKKIEKMTELYNLTNNFNSEIRFRWIRLGIKAQWKEIVAPALKFITQQGRMKFVRPIYRDFYDWEEYRALAVETFFKNMSNYMFVTANMLKKDLHIQ